jgi:hypothetical protein
MLECPLLIFTAHFSKGNNDLHLVKALHLQKPKSVQTTTSLLSNTNKTSVKRQAVQFAMDCSGSTPKKSRSTTTHGQLTTQDSTSQSITPVSKSCKLLPTRPISPYNAHQDLYGAHSATENNKRERIQLLPVSTASQLQSGECIALSKTRGLLAN